MDLGKNAIVKVGEAVGISAAQAIGEPGTQLTMRTFHMGGIAEAGGDITMGLPRVEEIFEKRAPKSAAVVAEVDGMVMDIKDDKKGKIITILGEKSVDHLAPPRRGLLVKKGHNVKKGDFLTEGAANLNDILRLSGRDKAEEYILREIDRVYSLQGVTIARKHIEIVVRQMFSRSRIKKPGDTLFLTGEVIDNSYLAEENERMKREGGEPATAENLILGISEVALTTSSWLSAASFQNTSRVLIDTALKHGVDRLRGLKENVIVGRLIPAGSGTRVVPKNSFDEEQTEEE